MKLSPLLTARIVLSNINRNLRKYSVVSFKAFSKKKKKNNNKKADPIYKQITNRDPLGSVGMITKFYNDYTFLIAQFDPKVFLQQ